MGKCVKLHKNISMWAEINRNHIYVNIQKCGSSFRVQNVMSAFFQANIEIKKIFLLKYYKIIKSRLYSYLWSF